MTLRLSVESGTTKVDVGALVDETVKPGVEGGRELIALGRASLATRPGPGAALRVSERLGAEAAQTAIEMAAAFQMVNRIMMATGQPAPPRKVEHVAPALRRLGAHDFAHATLPDTVRRRSPGLIHRLRRRITG